jgi:hypothetical protein
MRLIVSDRAIPPTFNFGLYTAQNSRLPTASSARQAHAAIVNTYIRLELRRSTSEKL